MKISFVLAIAAFLLCAFTVTAQSSTIDASNKTIWQYLTSNETSTNYTRLVSFLLSVNNTGFDVVAYLNDSINAPITFFAPLYNLTFDQQINLVNIAKYHAYPGNYTRESLLYIYYLTSALFFEDFQQPALVKHDNFTITISDSELIGAQIITSNGVIHNIDNILIPPEPLVPFLQRQPDFSSLLALLSLTPNVLNALNSSFTILAPTNEAVSGLGSSIVNYLLQMTNESARDREDILKAHAIDHRVYYPSEIRNGTTENTLSGNVTFVYVDNAWNIFSYGNDNEAEVIAFNILTANAVIHSIDEVILPLEFVWRGAFIEGFTYSYEAIRSALPSLLQEIYVTVFLPENSAFLTNNTNHSFNATNIPYHVISGIHDFSEGVTLFETRYISPYATRPQVIRVNRMNNNIVINEEATVSRSFTIGNVRFYGISSILSLPEPPSVILTRYPTLHELLVVAGLQEAINAENTTIFAPQGFSPFARDVHPEWLDYLTNTTDGIDKLKVILLTHVVPSIIYSFNIPLNLSTATSKSGVELQIYRTDFVVTVNGIVVSSFDHLSTAGVIHTLADVIVPSTVTISLPQILSIQPEVSDFYRIVENAKQEETLVGKTTFIPTNAAVERERNLPTSGQFLNDLVNNHILLAEVGPLQPGQTFPTETHNTTIHISEKPDEPGRLVATLMYLGENVTSANIVGPTFSALPSSQGNAYLIDRVLYTPRESKPSGGLSRAAIIGIAVGAGVLLLIIIAILVYFCCLKRSSYQSVS